LRRSYEKILNEISDHVKKVHKVFPKQYNLYSFSFFGIIAGIGVGWLISWLINEAYLKGGLIFGFTIGLIAGRIIGRIRDKRLQKEGRVLE
jgi:F0F1-type ATP synthase assembly protein I